MEEREEVKERKKLLKYILIQVRAELHMIDVHNKYKTEMTKIWLKQPEVTTYCILISRPPPARFLGTCFASPLSSLLCTFVFSCSVCIGDSVLHVSLELLSSLQAS